MAQVEILPLEIEPPKDEHPWLKFARIFFSATSSQGFESDSMVFYIGSEPAQQIIPAITYLLNEGHQKFFLLSTNDLYRDRANLIVKAMLADAGAKVVGEAAAALQTSALIGTPESCAPILDELSAIGVDEVACFIDFGVAQEAVLESLPYLKVLRERNIDLKSGN